MLINSTKFYIIRDARPFPLKLNQTNGEPINVNFFKTNNSPLIDNFQKNYC